MDAFTPCPAPGAMVHTTSIVKRRRSPYGASRTCTLLLQASYGLPLWLRALLLNSLVFEMGRHRLGILTEALNNYSSSYTASRLVTKRDALRTEGEGKYASWHESGKAGQRGRSLLRSSKSQKHSPRTHASHTDWGPWAAVSNAFRTSQRSTAFLSALSERLQCRSVTPLEAEQQWLRLLPGSTIHSILIRYLQGDAEIPHMTSMPDEEGETSDTPLHSTLLAET